MDLVPLTDHTSLDGGLDLLDAGYDDVPLSSEPTGTFPEVGCHIHVAVENVTEWLSA